jgi:hypothetical protein
VHYSGSACMRPSLPGVMGRPSGDDGGGACRRSGQGEGGDRAAAGGGDGGQRWAVTWLGCVIAQARDGSQLTAVPQTFSSHNSSRRRSSLLVTGHQVTSRTSKMDSPHRHLLGTCTGRWRELEPRLFTGGSMVVVGCLVVVVER